LTRCIKLHSWQ
jgi:hypothetical protein